jgi:hypothetical protein
MVVSAGELTAIDQRSGDRQRPEVAECDAGAERVGAGEHPLGAGIDGPGREADQIQPDPGQGADARRRGELERVGAAAAGDRTLDQEGAGNQLQQVVAGAKGDRGAGAADDRAAVDHGLARRARRAASERGADPELPGYRAVVEDRARVIGVEPDADPDPADQRRRPADGTVGDRAPAAENDALADRLIARDRPEI